MVEVVRLDFLERLELLVHAVHVRDNVVIENADLAQNFASRRFILAHEFLDGLLENVGRHLGLNGKLVLVAVFLAQRSKNG